MAVHEKLRMLRNEKNLSQLYIAHKLNISQNAYSLMENGKTKINEERITQLAKILDVHPFELFVGKIDGTEFVDEIKSVNASLLQMVTDNNTRLIKHLCSQLDQNDKQMEKLLKQVEGLSLIVDISQRVNLLTDYK